MTTESDWVSEIGKPAYESIAEMVAALECDYDRLEELRDERDDHDDDAEVPDDFEVKELGADDAAESRCTCGTCGRSWDDAVVTSLTPAPAARCPFEDYHPLTWADANPEDAEELAELEAAAGECESDEDARTRIEEDALSVEVRSGWTTPGETMEAEDFAILLSTGGPAVRIRGELDRGDPSRAWLEVQDWGRPWTQYFPADQDTLLTYARCFSFGE